MPFKEGRVKLVIAAVFFVISLCSAESGSYAYYCCFMNDPSLDGYYADGFVVDGPFRANGPVVIHSSTPGRDNDPWFYSITLSSDYYLYGFGSSGVPCSTAQYENLWIEPYELMQQGSPWFDLGAEPLPFGPDYVDWQSIRTAAQNGGLFLSLQDEARVILRDSVLTVMETQFGNETVYQLSELGSPAVWIENGPSDRVYIRGSSDSHCAEEITMGGYGDFYLSGELVCQGDGMVGLVSVYGDLVIADDPETVEPGWPGYEIETDESLGFQCSMMALDGRFMAESWWEPTPQAVFDVIGGMQVQEHGYTGTYVSGFHIEFSYDERLLTENPPYYPEYELSGIHDLPQTGLLPVFSAAPNPFSSLVQFALPWQGEIAVYDQYGRLVAGSGICSEWVFDGSFLPAGIYVARTTGPSDQGSFLRLVKVN